MLKKWIIGLLVVFILALPLAGCGGENPVTSETTAVENDGIVVGEPMGGQNTYDKPQQETADQPGSSDARMAQMEAAVFQYPSQNDEWKYNVYDCYVELTDYIGEIDGNETEFVFPSKIEGLPVWVARVSVQTDQSDWLLHTENKITKIKFPDSLLVFEGYITLLNLEELQFPDGLVELDLKLDGHYNRKLTWLDITSLEFPDTLKRLSINLDIFKISSGITIPASVEYFEGKNTYVGKDVDVTILNPNMEIVDDGCIASISGYAGSTAARYCAENNIPFTVIG